jgi:hypothetical protein
MLFKRPPRLTPEQVLSSRPIRNTNLTVEELEDGGLRLSGQRSNKLWVRVLGLVFPVPKERRIELDAVGKDVWMLCDGEHTLAMMIEEFQHKHKLMRAEAEWSLRNYLRDLGKRGLVGFAVEQTANPSNMDGKAVESNERK